MKLLSIASIVVAVMLVEAIPVETGVPQAAILEYTTGAMAMSNETSANLPSHRVLASGQTPSRTVPEDKGDVAADKIKPSNPVNVSSIDAVKEEVSVSESKDNLSNFKVMMSSMIEELLSLASKYQMEMTNPRPVADTPLVSTNPTKTIEEHKVASGHDENQHSPSIQTPDSRRR
jgi:hypothetical protein